MRKYLLSPAKINLSLSIVDRKENGFHCLESLFWPLNFGDSIKAKKGTGKTSLNWNSQAPFSSSLLPSEHENIVTKVLQSLPVLKNRWDIEISKRIPMGGGMGGGSSNIGTILRELTQTNQLNFPELVSWSSQFGADIPFFLSSRPAWVTGIGDNVRPLNCESLVIDKLHFLLVLFPFGCETKLIFNEFKKNSSELSATQNPFPEDNLTWSLLSHYLSKAKNDLEPVVSKLYPVIKKVLEKLRLQNCLYAGLSGSGATCFAIFDSFEDREKTSQVLQSFFRLNNCKSIFAETFATH